MEKVKLPYDVSNELCELLQEESKEVLYSPYWLKENTLHIWDYIHEDIKASQRYYTALEYGHEVLESTIPKKSETVEGGSNIKFTRKPKEVEVIQYLGSDVNLEEIKQFAKIDDNKSALSKGLISYALSVKTSRGVEFLFKNDFLIKDSEGRYSTMSEYDFKKEFEPLESNL